MLAAVREQHPDKQVEVYFQDEARFGQKGSLSRTWALRGQRSTAVRQTKYDWLYVLAAVCPETGETVGMLSPHINVEVMNVFLEQFSATLADNVHAVMIWDQAGFHTGHDLVAPENITLVPLPPYSPELNPVENLWHYLRSHYWANRAFEDYAALEDAAMTAWQNTAEIPELVQSICHAAYTEAR